MPFFPLAGGEIVFMILCYAIVRWIFRSWRAGELEDPTLLRFLPRRTPTPSASGRPALRVIRGGRDEAPDDSVREQRLGHRPRR
jgi:hypothetical protein